MGVKTYLKNIEITAMIDLQDFLRDKVIIAFLADVGCRVSELLDIKVENIDLENQLVLIPHLKRRGPRKTRNVPIGERTARLLSEYIADMDPGENLIQLKRQQVYNIVRKAGEKIVLKGCCILNTETGKRHYVHPHSFRDSLAVSWLGYVGSSAEGQKALQEVMGHQSFATTMRYAKINPSTVKSITDEVRRFRFEVDQTDEVPPDHPAVQ
jgi:integrase